MFKEHFKPIALVKWEPPPLNVIKINIDGSSFGNPDSSGFGGLLRDALGNWLLRYLGSCGFSTNTTAEL